MARHIPNAAYDAYFDYFGACTRLSVVSDASTPTTLTNELAYETLTSGDFSVGVGDNDGRKMTVAQQSAVSVTAPGTTRHIVLSYWTGSAWEIRLVTTCAERAVDSAQSDIININSFYLNVNGPVAP